MKKTKTIKGQELKDVQRLMCHGLDKVKTGRSISPEDKIGYSIVDYRVASIIIKYKSQEEIDEIKKEKIQDMLQDYLKEKDPNHWVRRFARRYFDGSYDYKRLGYCDGRSFYNKNFKDVSITRKCGNVGLLRDVVKEVVVYYFIQFIATEFDYSYSHAQKTIVQSMSKEDLKELTQELITNYLDIYSY